MYPVPIIEQYHQTNPDYKSVPKLSYHATQAATLGTGILITHQTYKAGYSDTLLNIKYGDYIYYINTILAY